MGVQWAPGWNAARVQEYLYGGGSSCSIQNCSFHRRRVVGFKSPSRWISEERLERALMQGRRISRAQSGPVFACTSCAVHAAYAPRHTFIRRGQVYLVVLTAHSDWKGLDSYRKYVGRSYRVVAKLTHRTQAQTRRGLLRTFGVRDA
jgi:hypothetical protein